MQTQYKVKKSALVSNLSRLLVTIIGIAGLSAAIPVFAEAPVYDADSMPQDQAVNSDQVTQYYPPLPPPEQESNAFVPMQTASPNAAAAAPASAPAAATAAAVLATPKSSLSSEQRLQKLEQQFSNIQAGDAATRVESLQNQVQSLRNQIEIVTHQLEQLQNQQKNQYSDLDKRVNQALDANTKSFASQGLTNQDSTITKPNPKNKKLNKQTVKQEQDTNDAFKHTAQSEASQKALETKKAILDATNPDYNLSKASEKPIYSQPNVAEEQQIYQTAYDLIKSKKYTQAVNALQGMLKRYPSGQFASNAHYWLGELYGLMGKNTLALKEFNAVVQTYPESPRVSDAQLKVGLILAAEFKWLDAKSALKKVVNHYPGSASARLASEQLKQIKQAGH